MLEVFTTYGGWYVGMIVFMTVAGLGLPIPEEVPVITAGVLSSQGTLDPWLAFGSCLLGAIMGDCLMYTIGYHWGYRLLRTHPRLAHWIRADREAAFEAMVARHGVKVFFLARFMVGVRSPLYFAAGVMRVPFGRFLAYDSICATLVVGSFFGLAYWLGEPIAAALKSVEVVVSIVVAAVVLAVATWIYLRMRKRRARMREVKEIREKRASARAEKVEQTIA